MIKKIISEEFSNETLKAKNVLLRSSGMIDQAEIHIGLSGDEQISDIEMLSLRIEMTIRAKIPSLEKISIIPHSSPIISEDKPSLATKLNALRNLRMKKANSI